MSHQTAVTRKAEFSERALAFAADYAIFTVAWAVILKAITPDLPVLLNARGPLVIVVLSAVFIVYHAFFSCEGRVSLGKRLFGLRVANAQGEPLNLARAVIRSVTYVPSSFLTLGFFWALIDPKGQAWHDLAAGSVVVSDHPAITSRARVMRLAAGALVIAFALGVGWNGIWEPRYLKLMTVAHAQVGLAEVQALQASYHQRHGRYAGSLFALAEVSVDPGAFLRDMASLYDLNSFRFQVNRKKYAVATRALDVDSTLVAISGP